MLLIWKPNWYLTYHYWPTSYNTHIFEGNVYFPPETVRGEFLRPSETHTTCWWKGEASYHSLEVDGERNPDAAWFYPDASEKAKPIEGYVAFWRGVTVER